MQDSAHDVFEASLWHAPCAQSSKLDYGQVCLSAPCAQSCKLDYGQVCLSAYIVCPLKV